MTVYVDEARLPLGQMLMNHMIADCEHELHEMASLLGLRPEWFQNHGNFPHYDICSAKRRKALEFGAVSISRRELALKMREIRAKRANPMMA